MTTLAKTDTGRQPPSPRGTKPSRRIRIVGMLLGAALVAGVGVAGLAYSNQDDTPVVPEAATPTWTRTPVSTAALERKLGIRLTQVAVTGGGGLVDLRFQVLDPELAGSIHEAETPPALVEESSGVFLGNLLMGHSHSGPFKQAQTYYLIFVNDGNWVHRGDRVTVLLGGYQVGHVPVT
ncbi:MAG TPA: hypothetical protein VKB55_21035 [Nocardioidaceae bacterium]|nr:hypothetical protein [Nocardioidaceae bacterium]